MDQVEELINKMFMEHKGMVIPVIRDKASRPFTLDDIDQRPFRHDNTSYPRLYMSDST